MKSKFLSFLIRILSLIFFVVMLCFPKETLSGASTGLLLWFQTVLPTLLPCMILADFLLRIGADRYITRLMARPLSFLFGVSKDGCYGAMVGFLCGYPMGAKTAASLLAERRITRQEANYLLAFTNQPSPMFLIGYLCLGLFAAQDGGGFILPVMLGIYGSALMVSALYRVTRRMHRHLLRRWSENTDKIDPIPLPKHNKSADSSPLSSLESSMMTSFEVMVKIGGYMMLFSIAEAHMLQLPLVSAPVKYILMGVIEMTTGTRHIAEGITLPWSLALCGAITAFGGLSGFAQTANVLHDSGLSTRRYFLWKSLQGILAGILILMYGFLIGSYASM